MSFVGCHLDVVTANPDTWLTHIDPFKLTVEGDKLVGGGHGSSELFCIVCHFCSHPSRPVGKHHACSVWIGVGWSREGVAQLAPKGWNSGTVHSRVGVFCAIVLLCVHADPAFAMWQI